MEWLTANLTWLIVLAGVILILVIAGIAISRSWEKQAEREEQIANPDYSLHVETSDEQAFKEAAKRQAEKDRNRAGAARLASGALMLLLILGIIGAFAFWPDASSAGEEPGPGGGSGDEQPFDPDAVCPNGVDDSENFVVEATQERFLWQAHGSLEGRSGEEIVGAYYGDPGYACHQVAQEGKHVAVLYAANFGARNVADVNLEVDRLRGDSQMQRNSAEVTAVVLQSFFDNAKFVEEEPDDGTWTIATVSLDGQTVVEVVDVPIVEPVPAYCGLRPATSLDDPSASGEHADEAICYLVTHGVWAYETQLDHIPDADGAFELGAEVVEETTDTTVLANPEETQDDQTTDATEAPAGDDNTGATDPTNPGTQPEEGGDGGQGGGEEDDGSGNPGDGGSCEGDPGCEGEDPGSGGSGGDDCTTNCPGGGGGGGDGCVDDCDGGGDDGGCQDCPGSSTTSSTSTTTSTTTTSTTVASTTTTTPTATTTTTEPKGDGDCDGVPPWIPCP